MATAFQHRVAGTAFQPARSCPPRAVFGGARRVAQHGAGSVAVRGDALMVAASSVPVYKGDLLNKTYYPTAADAANVNKRWYIINAEGQTLGRLASLAATYLRGKHLPTYSPSMDMGAYVIVINAEKVKVSGNKSMDKIYHRNWIQRPGSSQQERFVDLQKRLPERIIEWAVRGMLPKDAMGRSLRLHLKAVKGSKHPHEAQQPVDITKEIDIRPKAGPGAQLLAQMKAQKAAK